MSVVSDPFAGWGEPLPDTPVDDIPPGPEVPEKIKKRYRKKKTKLEEAFPTYLQVSHPLTDSAASHSLETVKAGWLDYFLFLLVSSYCHCLFCF